MLIHKDHRLCKKHLASRIWQRNWSSPLRVAVGIILLYQYDFHSFKVIHSGIIVSKNSQWKADVPPVKESSIVFRLNQLGCYKNRRPSCSHLQYSIPCRTRPPPQRPPSCPNLLESLCMAVSLFPQPIEVKITVGCESAEWLYISKITGGIYQCHWDTPTGMNWVKWEQCIGQGPLTVTNAPPMATNRSVQIAKGL